MSEYNPDSWVIVAITTPKETIHKLLAGWYGGYLGSDSWKLSSGFKDVTLEDDVYTIPQYSGSVYRVRKNDERMSGFTSSIYAGFVKQLEGSENTIKIISMEEFLDSKVQSPA
jgi:hypothetical protein